MNLPVKLEQFAPHVSMWMDGHQSLCSVSHPNPSSWFSSICVPASALRASHTAWSASSLPLRIDQGSLWAFRQRYPMDDQAFQLLDKRATEHKIRRFFGVAQPFCAFPVSRHTTVGVCFLCGVWCVSGVESVFHSGPAPFNG